MSTDGDLDGIDRIARLEAELAELRPKAAQWDAILATEHEGDAEALGRTMFEAMRVWAREFAPSLTITTWEKSPEAVRHQDRLLGLAVRRAVIARATRPEALDAMWGAVHRLTEDLTMRELIHRESAEPILRAAIFAAHGAKAEDVERRPTVTIDKAVYEAMGERVLRFEAERDKALADAKEWRSKYCTIFELELPQAEQARDKALAEKAEAERRTDCLCRDGDRCACPCHEKPPLAAPYADGKTSEAVEASANLEPTREPTPTGGGAPKTAGPSGATPTEDEDPCPVPAEDFDRWQRQEAGLFGLFLAWMRRENDRRKKEFSDLTDAIDKIFEEHWEVNALFGATGKNVDALAVRVTNLESWRIQTQERPAGHIPTTAPGGGVSPQVERFVLPRDAPEKDRGELTAEEVRDNGFDIDTYPALLAIEAEINRLRAEMAGRK